MYDVIIVGARVAGSSTAMLLAEQGLDVLLLDRASFPSDTISTHIVQLPGVSFLKRHGILDDVLATGVQPVSKVRIDAGEVVLDGTLPSYDDINFTVCVRRIILDDILLKAAIAAGAEFRSNVRVDELIFENDRVSGVRFKEGDQVVEERAKLVIGADGKHSMVAEAVGAEKYNEHSPQTIGVYTYWEGLELNGSENCGRKASCAGLQPTNNDQVMVFVGWPIDQQDRVKADVEASFLKELDEISGIGKRAAAGKRVDRFHVTTDLPNFFRKPYGNGWALVGDAGLVMDPITAQGISDALRESEFISDEIVRANKDELPLESYLASYQEKRDVAIKAMYDWTVLLASFASPLPEREQLLESLVGKQDEIDRYLGVIAGASSVEEYFNPENLNSIIKSRQDE